MRHLKYDRVKIVVSQLVEDTWKSIEKVPVTESARLANVFCAVPTAKYGMYVIEARERRILTSSKTIGIPSSIFAWFTVRG
jgi:hypothetical protein